VLLDSSCNKLLIFVRLGATETLIRPIVICGCEAWTLTSRNEQQLRIFERKILRKIFGPVQDEYGIWRILKEPRTE